MTILYQYTDKNFRLVSTHNHLKHNNKEINKTGITDKEEIERISISRSKRAINEIIQCNNWDYFFTCTVNGAYTNRYDLNDCLTKLQKILKKIKRGNSSFKYLFIIENHKDGAFHFHGVCTNLGLYVNDNGYYSNWHLDDLGYNSFSKIKDTVSVSYYILKYITKNCLRNDKGSCYFCSRGLKRATVSYLYDFNLRKYDKPEYHYYIDSANKIKNTKYDKSQLTDFFSGEFSSSLTFNCDTINKNILQDLVYNMRDIERVDTTALEEIKKKLKFLKEI